MNDLISRKALCDYALNQKDKSVTPNDIMRFPSAQPEHMSWTLCRHQMPENNVNVLFCRVDGEIFVGHHFHLDNYWVTMGYAIPDDDGWVCTNPDSHCCADWTEYND